MTKINFFLQFWPISKLFEIFENFDQNRIFYKIWPNQIFSRFSKKSIFLKKNLTKIDFFFNILTTIDFLSKIWLNRYFSENLTYIEIFLNFL